MLTFVYLTLIFFAAHTIIVHSLNQKVFKESLKKYRYLGVCIFPVITTGLFLVMILLGSRYYIDSVLFLNNEAGRITYYDTYPVFELIHLFSFLLGIPYLYYLAKKGNVNLLMSSMVYIAFWLYIVLRT